jgi:hypothetical protein
MIHLMLFASVLFSCGSAPDAAPSNQSGMLSKSEIDAVFDLQEIGSFTESSDGEMLLGGRRFNPDDIAGKTYGRKHNLLNLSEEALQSLPDNYRSAALFGNPTEIRSFLKNNSLSIQDLDTAKTSTGLIDLKSLISLQNLSNKRSKNTSQLSSLALKEVK